MKLSHTEMQKYINLAHTDHIDVNMDPRAKYRFGQALFNVLPKEVIEEIHMTDKDFFYFSDDRIDEVIDIVYSHLVE